MVKTSVGRFLTFMKKLGFQFWKSHPVWLIIPIPDFFPPKNIYLKILVLVQVLGPGEGH
jgi:hypothetical protein